MKVLHTGDWHLGRLFYGTHLLEDQEYVLQQLYKIIEEESVDAIIVAGDVFDRAVPPVEAVRLWDDFLTKVGEVYQIPLCVISGNHDSGQRLAVGARLLQGGGIYVSGCLEDALQPVLLEDAYGPLYVYLLPYHESLELAEVLRQRGILERADEDAQIYEAWSDYVRSQTPKGARTIVVAHAFVAGGVESQSERALLVGGTEALSPRIWKDFSYTALGHLHRPQQVAQSTIRYSGSLLPYSFDEVGYDKSVTIVEFDGAGVTEIRQIPLEPLHPVVVLEASFEEVMSREDWVKDYAQFYVLVRLTDTTPVIDGMARLRQRFPYIRGLEIVRPVLELKDSNVAMDIQEKSETRLFAEFIELVRGEALSESEKAYVEDVWREIRQEEER